MLSVLLKPSRRWARSLWSVLLPSSRNLLLPMNATQSLPPLYPPDACVLSLTSCKKTSFIKPVPLHSAGASAAKEVKRRATVIQCCVYTISSTGMDLYLDRIS